MLVRCYRFATISVSIFLAVANVTAADADELKNLDRQSDYDRLGQGWS